MNKSQNILVTGGAGFVGSNLIERLLETKTNVRATLHEKPAQINNEGIEWVKCNLMLAADCQRVCTGIDTLIMAAAQTSGAMVIEKNPLSHLTPNVIMNTLLLEAAYIQGVKEVIFISSSTVYPVSTQAMNENDHTGEYFDKYHIVASMKYFSEQLCEMYATKIDNPMKVTVLRPGNIYGPYDDFEWESSHVLPAFIRRIVERHQPISVWGTGLDIKDFIYVDDFIDGVFAALNSNHQFEIFNISSGVQSTLKELLQLLIDLDSYTDAEVTYDSTKPMMIPVRLIDSTKAEHQLNFNCKTAITEGLKNTVDWYRSSKK